MKKGYYSADTINGVCFYDTEMDLDVEILNPSEFMDSLDGLDAGEIIYTFMDISDYEIFEEIEDNYGVNE